MSEKTGGPAFPVPGLQHDEDFNGMTLRDYFAAKAMHEIVEYRRANYHHAYPYDTNGFRVFANLCAKEAYVFADAMLAARSAA